MLAEVSSNTCDLYNRLWQLGYVVSWKKTSPTSKPKLGVVARKYGDGGNGEASESNLPKEVLEAIAANLKGLLTLALRDKRQREAFDRMVRGKGLSDDPDHDYQFSGWGSLSEETGEYDEFWLCG